MLKKIDNTYILKYFLYSQALNISSQYTHNYLNRHYGGDGYSKYYSLIKNVTTWNLRYIFIKHEF